MTARAEPMNNGDRPPTATRVKMTVNEKATTPNSPHHKPARDDDSDAAGLRVSVLWVTGYTTTAPGSGAVVPVTARQARASRSTASTNWSSGSV